MPSNCKVDCELMLEFEISHDRLEYLDKLEILVLRHRAGLPLIGSARYDFLSGKIAKIRRLNRKTVKRINRITRIMSTNGPGCRKCIAGGEDYE